MLKFRNFCGGIHKPLHQLCQIPLRIIALLIEYTVLHALQYAPTPVSLSGLYPDPWAEMCEIFEILTDFTTPTMSDFTTMTQHHDRICSWTSPLICKNPHVHSWSVAGSVPVQSSPQC